MRIVLISSGVRGPASYCLNLYKVLTKNKHDVLLISEAKWKKENIPIYQAKSVLLLGLVPFVYDQKELIKKIIEFKPDIIHHHWPTGTVDTFFWKIHRLGIPVVTTIHVSVNSFSFLFDKLFYLHFGMFKKKLLKMSSVISISKFIQNQIKSRVNIEDSRHEMIYAGVDTDVFRPEPKEETDFIEILFVGQIMPEKGIDLLVQAVDEIKGRKIRLHIIGDGHLKPLLMEKTKKNKNIIWVGFLKNQKEIAKYYAKVDLTALPTRWDEAFSLVPVESISCGTPVLASDKGGNPEIVINGKTGFLIKDISAEGIKKVLLNIDKKKLKAMRKACREEALKKYSFEIWGKAHIKLYNKILKK